MVELRLVRDRPYDVAGVEADGCSQCRQCRDQDTDDDFQNLLLAHNCVVVLIELLTNINSQRGYCPTLLHFAPKKCKKMYFYAKLFVYAIKKQYLCSVIQLTELMSDRIRLQWTKHDGREGTYRAMAMERERVCMVWNRNLPYHFSCAE